MNVVFWLLVLIGACAVWFLLWPVFGGVGKYVKGQAKDLKTEMKDEWEEKE